MESITDERKPFVFISYRRQDSSAAARWLNQSIRSTFGPATVFMDTETIRTGDEWPEKIKQALRSATVLIAVIGPNWLRIADKHGRRRIDDENDWVRNEIVHALTTKINLMPLLLSGEPPLDEAALPPEMQKLSRYQAFELRDARWEDDLRSLLSRLEEFGLRKITERPVRYPTPRVTLKELSREEISSALEAWSGWTIGDSDVPGREPLKRTEFRKAYEFRSFEDAMSFMTAATQHISAVGHHPRWENIWRTVTVWLTTWDIGYKPSKLDLELAIELDKLYKNYQPPKKQPGPL
jgi:pterin-4a-carbinolamine dehydratase